MTALTTTGLAMNMDAFDQLLNDTLRSRSGAPPAGLEQRILAHISNEPAQGTAGMFTTFERANPRRTSAALWWALAGHAAVFLVIFAVASAHVSIRLAPKTTVVTMEAPPAVPLPPRMDKMGGGGGQQGPTAASQGHLPKFAATQIVPPMAPPLLAPKLPVEPTIVVQPDVKMADNRMPDLGVPNSTIRGVSMGNGRGSGIGGGDGDGFGPGSGGGAVGGPMHIGGMVSAPEVLYSIEPEFSEEARKAKFSGNVQVYLWVDEQGRPSHVRVARGVGMGLDEKAVEAVKLYKFKPAKRDGKPVKVDMYVDVNFTIM